MASDLEQMADRSQFKGFAFESEKLKWAYVLASGPLFLALAYYVPAFQNVLVGHFSKWRLVHVIYPLIALIAALVIELLCVGWTRCTVRKVFHPSPSFRRDLIIYFFDLTSLWLLLGKILTLGLFFILGGALGTYISAKFGIQLIQKIRFVPLQLGVALAISDCVNYWIHRAFHVIPLLWRLHKYHHSASEFSVITARRDHPLVVPIFAFLAGLPAAVFGATGGQITFAGAVVTLHALLIHSEIRSDWGWFGRWVLISPHAHRVHHSKSTAHLDKNFSFILPIFDRIFGSYYHGSEPVSSLGVDDDYFNAGNPLPKELLR